MSSNRGHGHPLLKLMMNQSLILTRHMSKSFDGVPAVEDLTLDVPPGVIFGFIGPSGCGKTTTVRLLLGIEAPDEGEIQVFGKNPAEFGRREQTDIGYMPQQFVLYPELNVWENLNFAASIYGVGLRRNARLHTLLDLVELTGHENKKVRDLSGGMQRRLGLAASIVHQPQLIFLDEPTAGIDPILRRKFWDYFASLRDESRTLFITTQYVGEAAYCDYIGVMSEGRLLMVETPDDLRRRVLGGEIVRLYPSSFLNNLQFEGLKNQPFVIADQVKRLRDGGIELIVDDASVALPLLLSWCQNEDIAIDSANQYEPLFDDIFVELITQETAKTAQAEVNHD